MAPRDFAPASRASFTLTLCLVTFCLLVCSCDRQPTRINVPVVQMLNGQTMGTTYTVKIVPQDKMPPLLDISRKIQAELELVNRQMSTYRADSEISLFNASDSTDWFDVSDETAQTVELALEIARITEGAFDITVGPLVELWGFGPDGRVEHAPTDAEIERVRATCGYRKLEVRSQPPALRKAHRELNVDLSAIAKGHGVDRVAAALDGMQLEAYFVEVGGEVRTRGTKQDGEPWRIGIESPQELERDLATVIDLSDASLATSGDYRNFYALDGQRVSHTIDPRTGRPVQHALASASVIADRCDLADAVATSMMVVGKERGLELAKEQAWAVLFIIRGESGFESFASGPMDHYWTPEVHVTPTQGVLTQ